MDYARELGRLGFPADVIPSSEIQSGALRLGDDGFVTYGAQRYRGLVVLNSAAGQVESLAASDLRRVDVGKFHLELDRPTDVALWHDREGQWQGATQGRTDVPRALLDPTTHWTFLAVPPPPERKD
jgi:hypothetical protein